MSGDVWFTADLHLGHRRILEFHPLRGADLDEMHARLLTAWNANVSPRDHVYVLGDFYLGPRSEAGFWFHSLRGHKHLVVGNHDAPHVLDLPWTSVSQIKVWRRRPLRAVLCHYPMLTWDGAHQGSWMLHGHSHGFLRERSTTRMDVGIDTHPEMRPYHLDEIVEAMQSRSYRPVDHHGSER